MKKRSLSGNEAKLVLQLEWDNISYFDISSIQRYLRCSKSYAYFIAHSLKKKGWIEAVGRGRYLLIEARRGYRKIAPKMSPYIITKTLEQPYYLAYLSAAHHHHLTTQLPRVLYFAVLRQQRPVQIKHVTVRFITITKRKFFGFESAKIDGDNVVVSDLEKTILDALDRPELVGGIESVARFLVLSHRRTEFEKLVDYVQLMKTRTLAVRLGYLCDVLQLSDVPRPLLNKLKAHVNHNPVPLGELRRWGTKGAVNQDWNIVENIPLGNLLAEIEIR